MKIAFILFSNGLEYDDRIRKEMFSLREVLEGKVDLKIFAFSSDNNRAESGVLSYGIPYEYVKVAYLDSKKKDIITMLRKEYSFYSQVAKKVKDFDMLWVCDDQPFFFPLFSGKPVIWDLHEIPENIIGGRLKNALFHRMENRCRWLIHANMERVDYLVNHKVVMRPNKNLILHNYPDSNWLIAGSEKSEGFLRFEKWLGNNDYLYVQGLAGKGRFALETLTAIMEAHIIKAVVIGKVPDEIKSDIASKYPDSNDFIYFTGQIIQSETSVYMSHSRFSIVLYNANTANSRYCEPNRMYQSLGLGLPVIVGNNVPMRNVVEKYGNGIVLGEDGHNPEEIVSAIKEMKTYYLQYKETAMRYKDRFAWETQLPLFYRLLENNK